MATALAIVQLMADEIGLQRPSSIETTTSLDARQLLAMVNREGKSLAESYNWSELQKTGTITTVNGTASYALPADFGRLIDQTIWDQNNNWEILGPDTPQLRQWRRESEISQAGPRRFFRVEGNNIVLWPTPTTNGQTISFLYTSTQWCQSSGGTGKTAFTLNTDTNIVDEDLLTLGGIWRFLAMKGLDAQAARLNYQSRRDALISKYAGGRMLSLAPRRADGLLSAANIPDAGFGP